MVNLFRYLYMVLRPYGRHDFDYQRQTLTIISSSTTYFMKPWHSESSLREWQRTAEKGERMSKQISEPDVRGGVSSIHVRETLALIIPTAPLDNYCVSLCSGSRSRSTPNNEPLTKAKADTSGRNRQSNQRSQTRRHK